MISQTISHYRIVEKLGSGWMGVVHKAEDTLLHRFVAVNICAEPGCESLQPSIFSASPSFNTHG
jgi:hypothetical protein